MEELQSVFGRGVVKAFGSTVALRGIDFEIGAAGLTLIEGANGSGKSTLLGIIGTVIRATSGQVQYRPTTLLPSEVRRQLGWLTHDSLGYQELSGRENIELAARLYGLSESESWQKAQQRFELGKFAERPLRTCSRGQRQRIALARALVHAPRLILLDEPTTGLDVASVERLLRILDEELSAGRGVCVVAHDGHLFSSRVSKRLHLERGQVRRSQEG